MTKKASPPDEKMVFCDLVTAIVSHLNETTRAVAKRAGVNESQLYEIVSDTTRKNRRPVSEKTLWRMCQLMGWTEEDLLGPKPLALLRKWQAEHPDERESDSSEST